MYVFGGVTDVQSDKVTDSLRLDELYELHDGAQECTVTDVSVDALCSARRLYFCNVHKCRPLKLATRDGVRNKRNAKKARRNVFCVLDFESVSAEAKALALTGNNPTDPAEARLLKLSWRLRVCSSKVERLLMSADDDD